MLVHYYSIGYMHGDAGYYRFFAYLNLFMFSMFMLVLADNYLLLFFGWEGGGALLVPPDRLLVPQEERRPGGQEGLHRQPRGRLRLRAGVLLIFVATGTLQIHRRVRQAAGTHRPRHHDL